MQLRYSTRVRTDRIVAIMRLMVSLFVLVDALDAPASHGVASRAIFIAIAGYAAAALAAFVLTFRPSPGRWLAAAHVLDVLFFSAHLMAGAASPVPLFISVMFPIVACALRFRWNVALSAALTMLTIFTATQLVLTSPPAVAPPHSAVRLGAFALLAGSFIYLRAREEHVEREITALSAWPHDYSQSVPVRELLTRAGEVLRADRIVMTWEEQDEPWLHIAWNDGDDVKWIREKPNRYDPLVDEAISSCSFIVDEHRPDTALVHRDGDLTRWKGQHVHEEFRREFALRTLLSVALEGSTFSGRLFVTSVRRRVTADDLHFGELVARFAVARLDQFLLVQRSQSLAVGEERMRLSRDLHDIILQSLTGASLQIEAARALLSRDAAAADARLAEIQQILASDQRELRSFIRKLRPTTGPSEGDTRFSARLMEMADRYRKQWGMEVDIEVSGLLHLMSDTLRHEVFSIVSEAIANAAKHAQANEVRVAVSSSPESVRIAVRDNGRGFPFSGRFNLAQLDAMRRGPVTLKERISSLGGELVVQSSGDGASLDVTIPYD